MIRIMMRLLGVMAVLAASGCASAHADDVRGSAEAFEGALVGGDTASACDLLSDRARQQLEAAAARPCAEAVRALRLPVEPVRSVEVWGDNAQVRLEQGVLFLSSFASGWRVIGAGCAPEGDGRYTCAIGG